MFKGSGLTHYLTSLLRMKSFDTILKVSFRKSCEKQRFFLFFWNAEAYILSMINVVIYKLI